MISRGRTVPPHGRAWALLTIAALAALVLVASAASASRHPKSVVAPHRNDRLLVAYKRGLTASARTALKHRVGAWTIRTYLNGSELLRVRPGRVAAVVKALRASGQVRYAEPDYIERESAVTVPNDPSFAQQWAFQNTGQSVGGSTGTPGDDERAAAAWSVTTGSRSIVVAEVDSGVDYNHPDLAANVWSNPGGINGCAAGTHGYNVLNGTCDPMDDDTAYGGHGTHVAGIIGAVGNNGVGVTGVNWQTTHPPGQVGQRVRQRLDERFAHRPRLGAASPSGRREHPRRQRLADLEGHRVLAGALRRDRPPRTAQHPLRHRRREHRRQQRRPRRPPVPVRLRPPDRDLRDGERPERRAPVLGELRRDDRRSRGARQQHLLDAAKRHVRHHQRRLDGCAAGLRRSRADPLHRLLHRSRSSRRRS